MKNQQGLSPIGFIFVVFLLGMGTLLAFKLFPVYTEYFMIQRTLKNLTVNPGLQDVKAVRGAFQRYAIVNSVSGLDENDLEISRTEISAKYSVRVPLIANISLFIEFNPSASVD